MTERRRPLLVVDETQVAKLAASLSRFRFTFDPFDEPLLYPAVSDPPDLIANYFFFLVAIDHRTQRQGRKYIGQVDGVSLHGAELLWALAKRRYDSDPGFFSPERMAKVTSAEVARTFRVQLPTPVDVLGPEERATLLRDSAKLLASEFRSSALVLVERSKGFLVRSDGEGLLQFLKRFKAYSDPLNKKSFLLVKFLERRGLLQLQDPQNVHVPVDDVLQRVALRTGIARIEDGQLERKIKTGTPITSQEDLTIRGAVSTAFDALSTSLGMSPTRVDDIFWEFGRTHCTVPGPHCDRLSGEASGRVSRLISEGRAGACPFAHGCRGFRNPDVWTLKEPVYETIYY